MKKVKVIDTIEIAREPRNPYAPRAKSLAALEHGLVPLKKLYDFHARLGSHGKSAKRHLRRLEKLGKKIALREAAIKEAANA